MFFYMQCLVKKISLYHLIKIPSWFQFYTFLFSDFILLQFPWTYLKSLVVFKRVQNLYKFFLLAAVFQAKVCCTIISSEHITGLSGCNWKKKSPLLLMVAVARWEGGGRVLERCRQEKRRLFHRLQQSVTRMRISHASWKAALNR